MTPNTHRATSTAQAEKSSTKPMKAAWPMPAMAKFSLNSAP